jgi:hypothetical protein
MKGSRKHSGGYYEFTRFCCNASPFTSATFNFSSPTPLDPCASRASTILGSMNSRILGPSHLTFVREYDGAGTI